jgi:patatin-like phospholipase/acyl hydrolase
MDRRRPASATAAQGLMSDSARPEPRSAGSRATRRLPLAWDETRNFRILAIDGGGIRGIFPAAVLAGLEERYLGGRSIAGYFDLVAGTSTGGIIALGLAAGLAAGNLRQLYIERGNEIFPPHGSGFIGRLGRRLSAWRRLLHYSYDQAALARVLTESLGDRKLGSAQVRLCIPSFEGVHGEVYIFKTPHHPDFRKDLHEPMLKVALATSAAPTYYRPLRDAGYIFVDGGVWANNPIMIALTEALTSFNVPREQVRILSLGCGDNPYSVAGRKISKGGMLHWRDIISAAMRLQSQNALGQAGLLIGPERMMRIDLPNTVPAIELDDWRNAADLLPGPAAAAVQATGDRVAGMFLGEPASCYTPAVLAEAFGQGTSRHHAMRNTGAIAGDG